MKICFFKYNIKDSVYEWIEMTKIFMWIRMIESDVL